MKKIILCVLCICLLSGNAYAFDITEIKPDESVIESTGRDVSADKMYLKTVAMKYSDRFVVTEMNYADISTIDEFYTNLSAPMTIDEIDNGETALEVNRIGDAEYQKNMKAFKMFGGLGGYSAEFEPIAYYNVYRNIVLVGGYVYYHKTHQNPDDAYWQYVCNTESITKEVIAYETRLKLLERVRMLSSFMDNDKSFKIFILKDNELDSMWEGVDAVG